MKLEFEMRIPVANWLLSRGLSPICECGVLNNCDMAGVRFTERPAKLIEMVAVELKMRDVAGVFRQCQRHARRGVTEVWAAMFPEWAHKHHGRFAAIGVGVLSVSDAGVEVVSQATRREETDLYRYKCATWRRRNEYLWRMKNKNMLRSEKPTQIILGDRCVVP